MRIIFFCGNKSRYGMAHLKPILESDFEVAAVVFATPERWAIFRQALTGKIYFNLNHRSLLATFKRIVPAILHRLSLRRAHKNVERLIKKHQVPLWYAFDVNSPDFINKTKAEKSDLIISAAYPQIFKTGLLDVASHHAVNFHPSLLPKFRGAHPHFWTIVEGETESGVSAHIMTEEIDDGPLVAQRAFDIRNVSYATLYDRIVAETPALVHDVAQFFLEGIDVPAPQDPDKVSLFRNNRTIHSRIFWNIHTAERIKNLSRTGTAFFFFRNEKVFLLKASDRKKNRNMTNGVKVEYGTIVDIKNDSLVIKANAGFVHIERVRYRGKELNFIKWAKRYRINLGEILQ